VGLIRSNNYKSEVRSGQNNKRFRRLSTQNQEYIFQVVTLQKLKLTLILMCIGATLLFFSWYVSYPISIDSPHDFVYNHISWLYWLSLPILFISFFIVATKTKKNTLRWVMAVGTVLVMYSLPYFYYMIPGPDVHQFRALTEYFISTGDLSSKPYHDYYQWPLFFILNKIATSITGLNLMYFEFILYGTIGLVITSSLYIYASKTRANGYLATIAFFIILSYFFNYQWAPFSLSVSLLLLLFVLDNHIYRRSEAISAMLIIFTGMTLAHAFVPVFFIIWSFLMYVTKKNETYPKLFVSTLIIYLLWEIYSLASPFPQLVKQFVNIFTLEYGGQVEATLASSVAPQPHIDIIAQIFSRTVVVTTTIVTGVGFLILLIRKKLRRTGYCMFLAGMAYAAIGVVFPVLGARAFFLIAIPASLGASYLGEIRFQKYFKLIFLALLILSTFVLVHKTFYDQQIFFQTKREYQCANFMINNINWNTSNSLLSHFRFMHYLQKQSCSENVIFKHDFSADFPQDMNNYNYVAYTVGLGKSFLRVDLSVEKSFAEFEVNHFNLIYNSGNFSYVFSSDLKR
jgi:hypothetical protein